MKKIARLCAFLLACTLLFSACTINSPEAGQPADSGADSPAEPAEPASSGDQEEDSASSSGQSLIQVTIPHYKSGENVGAVFFLPQVDRFNAEYEGRYHIEIEQIPNDMYNEKIKQLGQQNMLPALVEGGDRTWIEDVVIPGDMYYDLSGWLEEHPELKARFIEANLEYNTTDGKLLSLVVPVIRPVTLYYNGALFTPSKSMAELSWEELCEELGDNKIAFMTGENAWTTMLAVSSMIAVQPGGADILLNGVDEKIMDFTQEPIVNAFEQLQYILQNYASSNTVGATYAEAANNFMSGNSVVICNGSWMVADFAADGADKWSNNFDGADVRGDVLPGNVGLGDARGYGWWIPATATDDEVELALAFIEFMNRPEEIEAYMLAEGGSAPNLQLSDSFLEERAKDRLLDEYVGAVTSDTLIVPSLQDAVPSSIGSEELGKLLPKLIDGSYTAAEFCEELTKKAAETVNE